MKYFFPGTITLKASELINIQADYTKGGLFHLVGDAVLHDILPKHEIYVV